MGWFCLKAKKQPGSTRLKCWQACIISHSLFFNLNNPRSKWEALYEERWSCLCAFWLVLTKKGFHCFSHYITVVKEHIGVHTSVLKQLCNLVLGGSRNTMEGAQLGQSLHKVSVLTIQGSYSDSCHCKVLEKTSCNEQNELCAIKKTKKEKKRTLHGQVSSDIKSLALTQSSAQHVPCLLPTLHVSSVGRANWNKSTSLAVKRLSSASCFD